MWEVRNRTPFQAAGAFDRDKDGLESLCLAVRATVDAAKLRSALKAALMPVVLTHQTGPFQPWIFGPTSEVRGLPRCRRKASLTSRSRLVGRRGRCLRFGNGLGGSLRAHVRYLTGAATGAECTALRARQFVSVHGSVAQIA